MTADEIKLFRLKLGLTQEQLAHKIGATLSTVNTWERGRHRPTGLYRQALESLRQVADKE